MGVYRDLIRHYEKLVQLNEEVLNAYASGLMDHDQINEQNIKTITAANVSLRRAIAAFKAKAELVRLAESR